MIHVSKESRLKEQSMLGDVWIRGLIQWFMARDCLDWTTTVIPQTMCTRV